jgi:putative transposase
MPRTARITFPGAIYHVYARGNEKRAIFRDDTDRLKFISILSDVKKSIDFEIYAYVLMPNHYHILMCDPEENLAKIMKLINTAYAVFFNWRHKRVGHLFQGRFKSIIVGDDEYFLELTRYIHLNPVTKDPAKKPDIYKWSSFHQYSGKKTFGVADPGKALLMFDKSLSKARKRYIAFLAEGGKIPPEQIMSDLLTKIAVGGAQLTDKICERLKKMNVAVPKQLLCRDEKMTDKIIDLVCGEFGVGRTELMKKKGKHNYARKAAMYLVWKNAGVKYGPLGELFGNMHKSNVIRTVRSAGSEMRISTEFTSMLQRVELQL